MPRHASKCLPGMDDGGAQPPSSLLPLLADLAGQHEHLAQVEAELASTLGAARASAEQVRELLLQVEAHREPKDCSDRPDVPSEWQRQLKCSQPMNLAKHLTVDCQPLCPQGLSPRAVLTMSHKSAQELLTESKERRNLHAGAASPRNPDEVCTQVRSNDRRSSIISRSPRSSATSSEPCVDEVTPYESEDTHLVRRNAVLRMSARLGHKVFHRGSKISAIQVHKAVTSLGLVRYSPQDLEEWIMNLKMARERQEALQGASASMSTTVSKALAAVGLRKGRRAVSRESLEEDIGDSVAEHALPVMPFGKFVDTLLSDETLSFLELEHHKMTLTIREVLFSGDANRLVAELTHVRVDDVATPIEKPGFLTYVEPCVGVTILLNGIFIGLQTQASLEGEPGYEWFFANLVFSAFFSVELLVRLCVSGFRAFLKGAEKWWNLFDILMVLISLVDIVVEVLSRTSSGAKFSVVRTLRLTRLSRLVRIFRLKQMSELGLMVRGLLGGLRTLLWAVVLLFFTLYVIAILATSTIGANQQTVPGFNGEELFSTVPLSIFTTFRCFMGECTDSQGLPLVPILADEYGPVFVMSYIAAMIFVVFGLFNLIVAIYIENTLNAAKTEGEKTKAQRLRESVRIAKLTRQLLKHFCSAQRVGSESNSDLGDVRMCMHNADIDDVVHSAEPVSKEMFLCIIQDQNVQRLMDELDIPPDRASLFDTLDADGSGGLEVTELITGLLRVRGEARKGDVIGTLLAVRVCHGLLRKQDVRIGEIADRLDAFLASQGCKPRGAGAA